MLYKNKDVQPAATFTNSILNANPQFANIDAGKQEFNFHLKSSSPAVNAGFVTGVVIDITGKMRNGASGLPDLGCYEE